MRASGGPRGRWHDSIFGTASWKLEYLLARPAGRIRVLVGDGRRDARRRRATLDRAAGGVAICRDTVPPGRNPGIHPTCEPAHSRYPVDPGEPGRTREPARDLEYGIRPRQCAPVGNDHAQSCTEILIRKYRESLKQIGGLRRHEGEPMCMVEARDAVHASAAESATLIVDHVVTRPRISIAHSFRPQHRRTGMRTRSPNRAAQLFGAPARIHARSCAIWESESAAPNSGMRSPTDGELSVTFSNRKLASGSPATTI